MIGRSDYEERKQERIDRLNKSAERAAIESNAAIRRSHDLVKDIPLGQPNINGALTGVTNKARNAADRAVTLNEKSAYYAECADAAENNKMISSDDPAAIEKLKEKIAALEAKREEVKAFNKAAKKNGTEPAPWYTLPYISRDIKAAKERVEKLERLDAMPAELIRFDGGEIICDIDINRVQIKFDERQDETIISKLKNNGFKWAPSEQAWQRLRSPGALYAAKNIFGVE